MEKREKAEVRRGDDAEAVEEEKDEDEDDDEKCWDTRRRARELQASGWPELEAIRKSEAAPSSSPS